MTLETFLEKLEQTPRDWQLVKGSNRKLIRRSAPSTQCPVSALENKFILAYRRVAKSVGLPTKLMTQIVAAADGRGQKRLRAKLLKACGLAAA